MPIPAHTALHPTFHPFWMASQHSHYDYVQVNHPNDEERHAIVAIHRYRDENALTASALSTPSVSAWVICGLGGNTHQGNMVAAILRYLRHQADQVAEDNNTRVVLRIKSDLASSDLWKDAIRGAGLVAADSTAQGFSDLNPSKSLFEIVVDD